MALFGSAKPSAGYDSSALNGSDKLMLFGSLLRDLSTGNGPETLLGTQQYIGQQALQRQKLAGEKELTGLFGGGMAAQPPQAQTAGLPLNAGTNPAMQPAPMPAPASIPSISDPATIQKLLSLKSRGVDISPVMEAMKANQPSLANFNGVAVNTKDPNNAGQRFGVNLSNVNGFQVDQQDPGNAGKFMPQIAAGARPVYDENRNVIGQVNMDGTIQTMADQAGAVAGAQERAKSPYDFVSVPTPTGAPRTISKFNAAGGDFLGQSPTEATVAGAATNNRLGLPQVLDQAKEAVDLIEKMKTHPSLGARTGATGFIPAFPGTHGADFDAMADQLKGKVFLQAFSSLKGAGQITEVEGRKATDAIARLNRSQSKEGYVSALNDLESVIQAGTDRSKRLASPGAGMSARPPASAIQAEIARRKAAGLM